MNAITDFFVRHITAVFFFYGLAFFVKESMLFPSHLFSQANFLARFGVPVQLFRALMAAALTFFLPRALRAFDVEERRRLERPIKPSWPPRLPRSMGPP